MIRDILELGDPILRTPSRPVPSAAMTPGGPEGGGPGGAAPELPALVTDLLDTLHDFQRRTDYGRGIAAPQIGVLSRVVVIDPRRPPATETTAAPPAYPLVLVNPTIVQRSPETDLVWDACFSYWGLFFKVARSRSVAVGYADPDGHARRLEAEGELAGLLQHEIDHLDGVLAIDLIADPRSLCTLKEYERRVTRTSSRPPGAAR